MKKYNRTKIDNLDLRQLIYINYHEEQYGTDRLIINGMDYEERTKVNHPSQEQVTKMLIGYEDREAYLWNNMRGYSLVFRTESNEDMFIWDNLEKVN